MANDKQTAKVALKLINSLPSTEKSKLFKLLARHPENGPFRELKAAADRLICTLQKLNQIQRKLYELRSDIGKLKAAEDLVKAFNDTDETVKQAYLMLGQTLRELENARTAARDSKRTMSQSRIETAKVYESERPKHSSIQATLEFMVQLPSEENKEYATKYRRTHDQEGLRQYVKNLYSLYKKNLSIAKEDRELETVIAMADDTTMRHESSTSSIGEGG